MEVRYRTTVTAVGPQSGELAGYQMLILFAQGAPPELAEISLLHEPEHVAAGEPLLRPGDRIRMAGRDYRVTAVGDLANKNLRQLGHAVFKFTGQPQAEMPGDLILEAQPIPALEVGAAVTFWRPEEEA